MSAYPWHFIQKYTKNYDWDDGVFFIKDHMYVRVENEKGNRNILIKMTPEELEKFGQHLIDAANWAKKIMEKRAERHQKANMGVNV